MTGFWRAILLASAMQFCACTAAIAAQNDIIVLLANSESMRHHDPESLAAQALENYLQSISGDTRVAILSFAGYVAQIHPFTLLGSNTIDSLIERIHDMRPEGRHSNSAAAVERSIYELKTLGRSGADKAIILITDTNIHTGDRERDLDFERWLRTILAQDAATAQIRVFGIALGEQADIQNLQTLAFKTDGDYYRASDASEIPAVLSRIHEKITGISLPSVPPTTAEPVASPAPQPAAVDIVTAPETGQGATHWPSSGNDDDTAALVMNEGITDSPAPYIESQRPESGIGLQSPQEEHGRNESLVSNWLTASQLLLPALAISIVLFAIGTYLVFKARKRRESPTLERTQSGHPKPPCMLEDVHEITDRRYYDITGRRTWISRAPGENSSSTLTIVIRDDRISRDHALIEYKTHGYWISDRDSGNGTFVNDQKISDERLLKHGDSIRFADLEFNVLWPHEERPHEFAPQVDSPSLRKEGLEGSSTAYAVSEQAQYKQRRGKKAELTSHIASDDIFTDIGIVDNDSFNSVTADKGDTNELPQQCSSTATDEVKAIKEDTEELPRIELEKTVVKPSEQEPHPVSKHGHKPKSQSPTDSLHDEEEDNTRF